MKKRYWFGSLILTMPMLANAATEIYIAAGENLIPVDGVSKTETIEMNQFFESFSGKRFYFRVREGYESDLISLGTPTQPSSSSMAVESVSESVALSGDASAASEPEDEVPAILGPYELAGIYEYDIESGVDRGVDCDNATMRKVAPRTYEFICPRLMEMPLP